MGEELKKDRVEEGRGNGSVKEVGLCNMRCYMYHKSKVHQVTKGELVDF